MSGARERPRILMLVGEPTWSIDFNCRDVRHVLRDRY